MISPFYWCVYNFVYRFGVLHLLTRAHMNTRAHEHTHVWRMCVNTIKLGALRYSVAECHHFYTIRSYSRNENNRY